MAWSIGELGESNEEEVTDGVKMVPIINLGVLIENSLSSIIYGYHSCVFSW